MLIYVLINIFILMMGLNIKGAIEFKFIKDVLLKISHI